MIRGAVRPDAVIAGRETKILIDQIRTIDVSYVVGDLVDYLSRDDMAQVEHSLSRYFGLLRLLANSRRQADHAMYAPLPQARDARKNA
jgi:hypothetical protein